MFKLRKIRTISMISEERFEHSIREGSPLLCLGSPDFAILSRAADMGSTHLHQAAAAHMKNDELFKPFEIGREIARVHVLNLASHLVAVDSPVADKMGVALGAFEHGHDFIRGAGAQVGWGQDPAAERVRKDAAGEIAIEHLPLPGGEHVADAAHALSVPENLPSGPEFVHIESD